jgi:O-antigen/teichoic acid export membrane protein
MKKFFITNLIFLLTLNILIKSFWILGIDRGVQNALPASEYGVYYALFNFTMLFNILLDCGITNFNNRIIAQNSILLKQYFSKIIPIKIMLSVAYIIIVFIVATISGYNSYDCYLLFWLCLIQIFSSIISYLRSNISALMLFKTDSVISVLDKALMIIICSFLLWGNVLKGKFKIEYFIYAQVVSLFLTLLVALCICLIKTGFIRIKWNWQFIAVIFKYGFPYALLALLMSFYNKMDSVMLERILPDNGVASGIYASGFRLIDAVNVVSYLFSVILLPLFAKMIKEKQKINDILKISSHIIILVTVSFVIISVLYSNELMALLYNKHIVESARVYRILSFCFIPISLTYIFGTLLTANGSLKKLNIVAALGMILNIGCNLILIPKFKEVGSAYTSVIAQSITAILQVIIALKIFKIRFSLKYALKLSSFVVCLVLIGVLIHIISINWISKIIISLCLFVISSFIFNIFNIKEIVSYVKSFIISKNSKNYSQK